MIGPTAPGTAGKFWQFSTVPVIVSFVSLTAGVAVRPLAILTRPEFFGSFGGVCAMPAPSVHEGKVGGATAPVTCSV